MKKPCMRACMHASQTGEEATQSATTDKKLKRTETGNTKEDNFMDALQAVRSELAERVY